jgi:hypothetical protein
VRTYGTRSTFGVGRFSNKNKNRVGETGSGHGRRELTNRRKSFQQENKKRRKEKSNFI